MRIYRVIVRGRFGPMDPTVTAVLVDELERVDPLDTYVFTREGTLTFDRRLDFWSVRAEVRVDDESPDPQAEAIEQARAIAEAHLAQRGATGVDVRSTATDMATIWR